MDKKKGLTYDDNYRDYKKLFRWFKEEYSSLWVRGTNFIPYGFQEILVIIPGKGQLIYNSVGVEGNKIKWIDGPYEDNRRGEEDRNKMYQNFLREINRLQQTNGITQVDIAIVTGISRKSINKYLSGVTPPKVSTMQKMAEALNIDI